LRGWLKIPRHQPRQKFVTPVKTGIQVRLRISFKNRLDFGRRRNDGKN
jgi:hypothetical protein